MHIYYVYVLHCTCMETIEPWVHEPWVPGGRGHGGHAMDMGRVHGGGGESGEGGAGGHAPGPFKVI